MKVALSLGLRIADPISQFLGGKKGNVMMGKEKLGRLIAQLAALDILVGISAYFLQPFNERLTWVFIVSVIVLLWLITLKVISTLEALIH